MKAEEALLLSEAALSSSTLCGVGRGLCLGWAGQRPLTPVPVSTWILAKVPEKLNLNFYISFLSGYFHTF